MGQGLGDRVRPQHPSTRQQTLDSVVRKGLKPVSYNRVLSIQNLHEVPNPWKGFTLNRCLVLVLIIAIVSSGVNEFHDAVDYLVEETGSLLGSLQELSITQISPWQSLKGWWGTEEVGVIRRRKKPVDTKRILKPRPKE